MGSLDSQSCSSDNMSLSAECRARLDSLLHTATSSPFLTIPGATFIATTSSSLLYSTSAGYERLPLDKDRDFLLDSFSRLRPTSTHSLWSATKLVTVVAILQLWEQGLVRLDDDVQNYLMELREVEVLKGWKGEGTEKKAILEQKIGKITVLSLINHTAGFSNHMSSLDDLHYVQSQGYAGAYSQFGTRESITKSALAFQPGHGFHYGYSCDWLGLLVEKISGLDLGTYFQRHIFSPLQIYDMSYKPCESSVTCAYITQSAPDQPNPRPYNFDKTPPLSGLPFGGVGLFGSPCSYVKILQALLLKGSQLDPFQPLLLRSETIDLMFQGTLGHLGEEGKKELVAISKGLDPFFASGMVDVGCESDVDHGMGGLLTSHEIISGRSKGSLAWAGALGSYWVLDREKDIAFVFFVEMAWFGMHPPIVHELRAKLEIELYAGLKESRALRA